MNQFSDLCETCTNDAMCVSNVHTSLMSVREELANMEDEIIKLVTKRIMLGAEIARLKYESNTAYFNQLIASANTSKLALTLLNNTLNDTLTDVNIERNILERVRLKSLQYGCNPAIGCDIYKDFIIPKTKEIEIKWLLKNVYHL